MLTSMAPWPSTHLTNASFIGITTSQTRHLVGSSSGQIPTDVRHEDGPSGSHQMRAHGLPPQHDYQRQHCVYYAAQQYQASNGEPKLEKVHPSGLKRGPQCFARILAPARDQHVETVTLDRLDKHPPNDHRTQIPVVRVSRLRI